MIYEDRDLRGREAGEMTRLISGALTRHRPASAALPAGRRTGAPALTLASPADPCS